MPTFNLVEAVNNKMTCMYNAIVDNLIYLVIQIANCKSWLQGGYIDKSLDLVSLKLKVVAMCGDPKLLTNAIKSCPSAKKT